MVIVRVSPSVQGLSRAIVGIAGLAVLATLAVALLAPGASAAGSGFQVATDPNTDNPTTPAGNVVRLGAGSYNAASCPACLPNTMYVWFKVNAAYTVSAPTSADFNNAAWDYFIATNYGPQQWCTYYWLHSTASAVVTQGADKAFNTPCGDAALGYAKDISGAWVCNELQYVIPYTSMMTNVPGNPTPTTGTVVQFQQVPDGAAPNTALSTRTVQTGVTGFQDANWGAGSYTLGNAFDLYQPPPTGLTLTPSGDNQVTVSWTAPVQNSAQPITSYKVYRGSTYLGSIPFPGTSFVDTGAVSGPLASGTSYTYRVSSVNCPSLPGGGEGAQSAPASITPEFRPAAPTGVALSAGSPASTSLSLGWTASAYDCPTTSCTPVGSNPSGVVGYKLYAGNPVGTFVIDLPSSANCVGTSCSYMITGLAPSTNYCYYLISYDGFAEGPNLGPVPAAAACRSTTSSGATPPPPPPPPVGPPPPPPPPPPVTGCSAAMSISAKMATGSDTWVSDAGAAVSFVDKSVVPTGISVDQWEWEFGDGSTSHDQNPSHSYPTPGNFTIRLSIWDTGGCTSMALDHLLIVAGDGTPPAGTSGTGASLAISAGLDLEVQEGTDLDLVAVVVSGPDRDTLTFTWRQLAGPLVSTTGAATPVLVFTAPPVPDPDQPVRLTFGVRATDGYATSAEDTVDVVVLTSNDRPVARAGADQTVAPGATVTVDGSASSDPEGGGLSGLWEVLEPSGDAFATGTPRVTDLVQDGLRATFTAPSDVGVGYVDLRLNVTDERYSSADTLRIWIQEPAAPPAPFVAQAEPDGSVSFLATGAAEQYTWVFGDGNETVTDGPAALHRYADRGPYTVSLSLDGVPAGEVTIHAAGRDSTAARPEEPSGAASSGASWVPALLIAVAASVLVAGLLVWALRHRKS